MCTLVLDSPIATTSIHQYMYWIANKKSDLVQTKKNYFVVQCRTMLKVIILNAASKLLPTILYHCKCLVLGVGECVFLLGASPIWRWGSNPKPNPPPPQRILLILPCDLKLKVWNESCIRSDTHQQISWWKELKHSFNPRVGLRFRTIILQLENILNHDNICLYKPRSLLSWIVLWMPLGYVSGEADIL